MQGEGPYVGRPSVFVRLGGCDLRCSWCDSPHTWKLAERCRIETAPGCETFREVDNPLGLAEFDQAVLGLAPRASELVSITGGEPLLQPDVVEAMAARLHHRGLTVYLESHGLAVAALEQVVASIDIVSMDWKLSSDVRRAGQGRDDPLGDFDDAHEAFLETAVRAAAEVYVKVVLTSNTRDDELDELCRRIARVAPDTPLVLQPVTPMGRIKEATPARQLLASVRRCNERLADVRLIPQTHCLYGAL